MTQVSRMKSPVKPVYTVTGSIGTDEFIAFVLLDRKNSSIHIHFYGNCFGSIKKPILVKHSTKSLPDDADVDFVKLVVSGELTGKRVQIKKVTLDERTPEKRTRAPQRTIIRFRK